MTSAATAKTNPSETPFASFPSTGTGNRSASVDARRNAATPAIRAVDPGCATNHTVAARYAATPTRETGATTARSLAGGSARPFIEGRRPLPGEVEAFDVSPAVQRSERDEQGQHEEGGQL